MFVATCVYKEVKGEKWVYFEQEYFHGFVTCCMCLNISVFTFRTARYSGLCVARIVLLDI
jgi:hypothetical protein